MASAAIRPRLLVALQLPDHFLRRLERTFDIEYHDVLADLKNEQFLSRVRSQPPDAILFGGRTPIDKTLLAATGEKLKMLATFSVGYDHIDVAECNKRGIPIGYTPGVLTDATADLTVALLLATARRFGEAIQAAKNGQWGTSASVMWMCGKPLTDSTVGIVGLGRIGLAAARRLQPFAVKRFLYSGTREKQFDSEEDRKLFSFVPFEQLLRESDFIVITCALNEATKHLFNAKAFEQMKNDAIIINSSRGGVIDQDALYDALTNGKIQAAGLDVTSPEPLPTDHRLFKLDNCLILPHIGSADVGARHQMAQICVDNLLNFFDGKPMVHQLKTDKS